MSNRIIAENRFFRSALLISMLILLTWLIPGCSDDDDNSVVPPTNEAPVGVSDTYYLARGATLAVDGGSVAGVLANDTDANGDALTATLVAAPANHVGTFTLNADGTFTYVHDGSEIPNDQFTYRAGDGSDESDVVTVILAYPVVTDDSSFGDDTITVDLISGLRWLDVTQSTPYSYDTLTPELGPNGTFESFRRATRDEVKLFWTHAGIDTTLSGFVSENLQPVLDLMDFVGVTGTTGNLGGGNFFDYTAGQIESGPGGGGNTWVATISADPDPTLTGRQGTGTVPSDNLHSSHGAWLIESR